MSYLHTLRTIYSVLRAGSLGRDVYPTFSNWW